jgi:predicted RNase H-like nuclease (RuvC/YqgF family)
MNEVIARNEEPEDLLKHQRRQVPELERRLKRTTSELDRVKDENKMLWNRFTMMDAELEEARHWERRARRKLDAQDVEIQVAKTTNANLEVRLEHARCNIRKLEEECRNGGGLML